MKKPGKDFVSDEKKLEAVTLVGYAAATGAARFRQANLNIDVQAV